METGDSSQKLLRQDLREGLRRIYGDRLRGVYLYGSYARGQQQAGSDMDVLVVLDKVERYAAELQRTGGMASSVSLQHGISVSLVFVPEHVWETEDSAFLANVRAEAIAA